MTWQSSVRAQANELIDAGIAYLVCGAVAGAAISGLIFFVVGWLAGHYRGKAPAAAQAAKSAGADLELGGKSVGQTSNLKQSGKEYVKRHSLQKEGTIKLDHLLSADSSSSALIAAAAAPARSSTPRSPLPQLTLQQVAELEEDSNARPPVQLGFAAAPMRTLSVNRLMSLLPLSPSRNNAGSFKDNNDYALPSPRRPSRPKSNLGREVMEKQGSIARTFSSMWARMHRLPPLDTQSEPTRQSSFAIAASLAGPHPFDRAGAAQPSLRSAEPEAEDARFDSAGSGSNSVAESVTPKAFFPEQDSDRGWMLESSPSGMPRIVVRKNSAPSRGGSADGTLSAGTGMQSSAEGARGLRRRSSRLSRASDDLSLTLTMPRGTGRYLRASKSLAANQLVDNALFEEVDLEEEYSSRKRSSEADTQKSRPSTMYINPMATQQSMASIEADVPKRMRQNNDKSWTMGPGQWQQYLPAQSNLSELMLPEDEAEADSVDLSSPVERQLQIIPAAMMQKLQKEAKMMLVVRLEEILPRPGAGLLHRMLRLAPVDLVLNPATAEPVLVLRPHAQYQVGVRIYQDPASGMFKIMQCHMRMTPQDRGSIDLFLEIEPDLLDDKLWRASTSWDPSSAAFTDAKVSASGAAPIVPINVQVRISCQLASGPHMHLLINDDLQIQLIPRGGTSQLEECDMNGTWDSASSILLDWHHESVEWEGAEFPLLLAEA